MKQKIKNLIAWVVTRCKWLEPVPASYSLFDMLMTVDKLQSTINRCKTIDHLLFAEKAINTMLCERYAYNLVVDKVAELRKQIQLKRVDILLDLKLGNNIQV